VAAAALAPLAFLRARRIGGDRFETDEDLLNRSQPDPEINCLERTRSRNFRNQTSGYRPWPRE